STTKIDRANNRNSFIRTPYFSAKSASRWSDKREMFLTPFAAHQRVWANGKSMLIVRTCVLPICAVSSLKRFCCLEQTPVSTEGTTLINFTLPSKSSNETSSKSFDKTVKLGA